MTRQGVSVPAEVETIANAIAAGQFLVDMLRHGGEPSERDAERIPAVVGDTLALSEARLRLLARVLRGHLAPATILAPHNAVHEGMSHHEDLVLPADDRARREARR